MAEIRAALNDLQSAMKANPALSQHVQPILGVIAGFFAPLSSSERGSFEFAALYAQLGQLALYAGSAAEAEDWLRQAIGLDPHQPAAWADLVVAVAAQGESITADASAALAEIRDPMWTNMSSFQPPQLSSMISNEVSALEPLFPEQKDRLDAFRQSVEAQSG
jgi:tetratricopeptide (TPR) repeat protein